MAEYTDPWGQQEPPAADAETKKKLQDLVRSNPEMFQIGDRKEIWEDVLKYPDVIRYLVSTDVLPGYGASAYIGVIQAQHPDDIVWHNPADDPRPDWHWGHSTIIAVDPDFTKIFDIRGNNA